VKSVAPTLNPLDAAVTNPLSAFRILSNIYSVVAVACTVDSLRVLVKFYRIQGNNLPLRSYCTYSLVLIVIANVLRVVKSIDVMGFLQIYPFITARELYAVTYPLCASSILGTYFYWIDMISTIKASLALEVNVIGNAGKVILLFISFCFIGLEVLLTALGYKGRLPGDGVSLIPVVYALIGYSAFVIAGLRVSVNSIICYYIASKTKAFYSSLHK
jgi:hypothetical protein